MTPCTSACTASRNDDIVRDFFGAQLTDEEVREHGAAKERLYRERSVPW